MDRGEARTSEVGLPSTARVIDTIRETSGCLVIEGCIGSGINDLVLELRASEWALEIQPTRVTDLGPDGVHAVFAVGLTPQHGSLPLEPWVTQARCIAVIGAVVDLSRTVVQPSRIGLAELSLRADELASFAARYAHLDLSLDAAAAIADEADGWNRYAIELLEAVTRGLPVTALAEFRTSTDADALVAEACGVLEPDDAARIAELCHFDWFPPEAVDRLIGVGGAHKLRASGFPCRTKPNGAIAVLEPVRSRLGQQTALTHDTAVLVGDAIETSHGTIAACEALIRAGEHNLASRRIRQLPAERLASLDQTRTAAILHTLIRQAPDDGSLSLALARVEWGRGNLDEHRRNLKEAAHRATAAGRPELEVEIEAEELLADLPLIDTEVASERLEHLLARPATVDTDVSLRLLEVEGMVRAQSSRSVDVVRSIELLTDVARQRELRGQPLAAARILRNLCVTALEHLGRYDTGIQQARHAIELAERDQRATAAGYTILVRMKALAGDVDEFDELSDRATDLGRRSELSWIEGHVNWSRMLASGVHGDARTTLRLHRAARDGLGQLLERVPGSVFLAESALAMLQVGDNPTAGDLIDAAATRFDEAPLEVGLAEIAYLARTGRAQEANARYEQLRTVVEVPASRDWRFQIELAHAHLSNGRPVETAKLGTIRTEASSAGASQLYRRLVSQLDLDADVEETPVVRVFGQLTVEEPTGTATTPDGQAARLLRMLAVAEHSMHVDVIIDRLWPDATTDIGRRRLKNVMSRLRTAIGHANVHRRGDLVWLDETVEIDVRRFRRAVAHIASDHASAVEVRRCLGLFVAPPLPEDRMEDWAREVADQLTHDFATAIRRGVETRSITPYEALTAFLKIDTLDDALCISIARYAIEMHDTATAARAAQAAADICKELDVPPPDFIADVDVRSHSPAVRRAVG